MISASSRLWRASATSHSSLARASEEERSLGGSAGEAGGDGGKDGGGDAGGGGVETGGGGGDSEVGLPGAGCGASIVGGDALFHNMSS